MQDNVYVVRKCIVYIDVYDAFAYLHALLHLHASWLECRCRRDTWYAYSTEAGWVAATSMQVLSTEEPVGNGRLYLAHELDGCS